jgi:manganese efflux pump family protein
MSWPYLVGLALALAMDAFAVSVGVSLYLGGANWTQSLRMAVYFGLFQGGMTALGWLAGREILVYIQTIDHWVAFILLSIIGGHMLYEALSSGPLRFKAKDPTRGFPVLVLSVATSIDAMAAGMSIAVLQQPVLTAAVIIGVTALVLSLLAARTGPALGRWAGKSAELAGGVILILIGIKIFFDHMVS